MYWCVIGTLVNQGVIFDDQKSVVVSSSHSHISKRTEHLSLLLILLHVLAERAMATLHVSKFVLILNEEAAAVIAHSDSYVGYHVLKVALGHIRAEVIHILNENLLKTHASHHLFVYAHGLVILRGSLMLSVL